MNSYINVTVTASGFKGSLIRGTCYRTGRIVAESIGPDAEIPMLLVGEGDDCSANILTFSVWKRIWPDGIQGNDKVVPKAKKAEKIDSKDKFSGW